MEGRCLHIVIYWWCEPFPQKRHYYVRKTTAWEPTLLLFRMLIYSKRTSKVMDCIFRCKITNLYKTSVKLFLYIASESICCNPCRKIRTEEKVCERKNYKRKKYIVILYLRACFKFNSKLLLIWFSSFLSCIPPLFAVRVMLDGVSLFCFTGCLHL